MRNFFFYNGMSEDEFREQRQTTECKNCTETPSQRKFPLMATSYNMICNSEMSRQSYNTSQLSRLLHKARETGCFGYIVYMRVWVVTEYGKMSVLDKPYTCGFRGCQTTGSWLFRINRIHAGLGVGRLLESGCYG